MQLRKGDEVCVMAGKDKGKHGVILEAFPASERVLVEGLNLRQHFVRPNPDKGVRGGIETKEAPLHVSNVMLFDKEVGKPSRVGCKVLEDGRKVRCYKRSGRVVDV